MVQEADLSRGDEQLMLELFLPLRRFAAVVCPDLDPEDVLQDAIVQTLRLGSLDRLANPGAYLRRSILNIAANERRSLGRRRRATQRLAHEHPEESYPSDLQDLLHLSPDARAVLYLTIVDGLSYSEAAEALGCRETTARARASRALKKLRAIVAKEARE